MLEEKTCLQDKKELVMFLIRFHAKLDLFFYDYIDRDQGKKVCHGLTYKRVYTYARHIHGNQELKEA